MKLTVHDPQALNVVDVMVDGQSVMDQGVTAFDTDAGWVEVYVRDADGQFVVTEDYDVERRVIHGHVQATLKKLGP